MNTWMEEAWRDRACSRWEVSDKTTENSRVDGTGAVAAIARGFSRRCYREGGTQATLIASGQHEGPYRITAISAMTEP